MSTADDTVIKSIRRKVNGAKRKASPKPPSVTMAEIEALAGKPVDFDYIYTNCGEAVRKKLFIQSAATQLRDYVNSLKRKNEPTEYIAEAIRRWLPELKRRGKSPVEKAKVFVAAMTPEERAELVKLLNG